MFLPLVPLNSSGGLAESTLSYAAWTTCWGIAMAEGSALYTTGAASRIGYYVAIGG